MTPAQTRQRFAKIVEKEGKVMVAVRLGCSVDQVAFIASGKRNPGLRIACAIEEVYEIPMKDWIDRPASRSLK